MQMFAYYAIRLAASASLFNSSGTHNILANIMILI